MDKAGIGGGDPSAKVGAPPGAPGKKGAKESEADAFEAYRRNKSYSFRRF